MAEPTPVSSFHYIATDPTVMGALAWVGLVLTLAGLAIAIWQILKIKSSAQSAFAAVRDLSGAIHARERILDITSALRFLDNARHHISQRDYAKAIIFLEFSRNECLQVREISMNSGVSKKDITTIIVRLTALIESVTLDDADERQDETATERNLQARAISDELNGSLAKLRYRLSGDVIHHANPS